MLWEKKRQEGFYWWYFTVPRGSGVPSIVLKAVAGNIHLGCPYSHSATDLGDQFSSINLKDAHFHLHSYPGHRKLLRFTYQGIAYKHMMLIFWVSLALRVLAHRNSVSVRLSLLSVSPSGIIRSLHISCKCPMPDVFSEPGTQRDYGRDAKMHLLRLAGRWDQVCVGIGWGNAWVSYRKSVMVLSSSQTPHLIGCH